MNKSPAFQFYPDKWQTHTAHLSDSAYRLYHEMLCWMWQHSKDQCSIPSNPETISILMRRVSDGIPSALQEIMNPAMPLLKIVGENYISDGLRKEVKKQTDRRRACSDSAKSRWDKELRLKNESCERNANAMPNVCSPSPSPSPSPTPYIKEGIHAPFSVEKAKTITGAIEIIRSHPGFSKAPAAAIENFFGAYKHIQEHWPKIIRGFLTEYCTIEKQGDFKYPPVKVLTYYFDDYIKKHNIVPGYVQK
jgi:hypothetical protein